MRKECRSAVGDSFTLSIVIQQDSAFSEDLLFFTVHPEYSFIARIFKC